MEIVEDKSIGVLPVMKTAEGIKILLVQQKKGHWGLPKGHPEVGESELETARRELFEETGITEVEFVPGAKFEEVYDYNKEGQTCRKTVIFYPGFITGEPKIPAAFADEILDVALLPPAKAWALFGHPEVKRIIEQALTSIGLN